MYAACTVADLCSLLGSSSFELWNPVEVSRGGVRRRRSGFGGEHSSGGADVATTPSISSGILSCQPRLLLDTGVSTCSALILGYLPHLLEYLFDLAVPDGKAQGAVTQKAPTDIMRSAVDVVALPRDMLS